MRLLRAGAAHALIAHHKTALLTLPLRTTLRHHALRAALHHARTHTRTTAAHALLASLHHALTTHLGTTLHTALHPHLRPTLHRALLAALHAHLLTLAAMLAARSLVLRTQLLHGRLLGLMTGAQLVMRGSAIDAGRRLLEHLHTLLDVLQDRLLHPRNIRPLTLLLRVDRKRSSRHHCH